MGDKIKVAGYSKKVTYDYGNIQYRDFNPDLVGLQFTTNGGDSLFTMGNFSITTNLDPKLDKNFITGKYGQFLTLDDLDLTVEESQSILNNNTGTILNLDNTKLKNYALFGSMTEYVRVSLENIITKWPAALYAVTLVNIDGFDYNVNTYEDYYYDSLINESTFKINTSHLSNPYEINFLTNGTIIDTFNETNDLRNLTINYDSYVILNKFGEEYPVIGFTGSTYLVNDYLHFKVKGNVFTGNVTTNNVNFHIKPKKLITDTFFNELKGIEKYLLNRDNIPLYTSTFEYPMRSDSGVIMYTETKITWPVVDGYNIDFNSDAYLQYATNLLEISTNYDLTETGLMNRFLVSESISAFDTVPVHLAPEHEDTTTGQKVNKTLNVYGRSFDDFNQFIEGISFAHNVTYDKKDNLPDKYLKDLAKILGWDLVSLFGDKKLLNNFVETEDSSFSGVSVGLTPAQTDIEMWRRIILNTPWIWKSKGARKSIEFFLNFMGVPKGLISFNEYIYKAKAPINMDIFLDILLNNNIDDDLSLYPIDSDGYPKPLSNSDDIYFQGNGLWFRETGGANSTRDITTGNNPHAGPYDGGDAYIQQFRKIIPNFSAITLDVSNETINSNNLFLNYKQGDITSYDGVAYIDILNQDNEDVSKCVVYEAEFIKDPMPTPVETSCGCPCEGEDDILSVCLDKTKTSGESKVCDNLKSNYNDSDSGFKVGEFEVYNRDKELVGTKNTVYFTKECCTALGGKPNLYESMWINGLQSLSNGVYNRTKGYVCCTTNTCSCKIACDWSTYDRNNGVMLDFIRIPENSGNYYIRFKTLSGYGSDIVVSPDGSNCPSSHSVAVGNITDPFSGELGFGCRLTERAISNINTSKTELLKLFEARRLGTIGCCDLLPPTNTKSLYE